MATVKKGDKITAAQINDLLTKLNNEADRRGYSKKVAAVSQYKSLSYDTMKQINDYRIEIGNIYHKKDRSDIASCSERSDKKGTPDGWDGRDLTKNRINSGEDMLVRGRRAYASQYNTLLSDIEKLNALCECNTFWKSATPIFITCSINCGCNNNFRKTEGSSMFPTTCDEKVCQTVCSYDCLCQGVSKPCMFDGGGVCASNYVACSINYEWGACTETTYCKCQMEPCGHWTCTCNKESVKINCGNEGADICSCQNVCQCDKVCNEYAK